MRPHASICLTILILLLLLGGTACAHGGQYRGPGGPSRQARAEPEDPTPPPPPPPSGAPVTEPPSGRHPAAHPLPSPRMETRRRPRPTPTDFGGGQKTGGRPSLGMDSWMFWYE